MTPAQSHLVPTDRGGYEAVVRDACHVRRFEHEPVPCADVELMVALVSCAATPCSAQAWRLIAVQDHELLAAMQAAVMELMRILPDDDADGALEWLRAHLSSKAPHMLEDRPSPKHPRP